jgi:hypothetical protein
MRRRLSWIGLLIGLAAGLAIGLFYAWVVNPVVEYDTAPWQLSDAAGDRYISLIGLAYQHDQNLARADERLRPFDFDQPGVEVARRACDFFRRAEDFSLTTGLVDLAHAYGETTCADIALGPTGTPAGATMGALPTPVPSVTPTFPGVTATVIPSLTRDVDLGFITPTITRTPTPVGAFAVVSVAPFCNPRFSGVIEVYVWQSDGTGIPGVEVLVTWPGGEDRFFTGLQPGEDPGFANFTMEEGEAYRVELPERSNPSRELAARPCTPREALAEDEEDVITGYAVTFER